MYRINGAKSITPFPLHETMRTAVSLIFLLLIASSMSALTTSAEVTNDGSTITVTGTETWNASNPIDLDLMVTDGASLFVDESTTVNAGVTITVATGASLTLNGDLMGSNLDAGLLVYNATELHLDFGDLSETGQVRINLDHVIPETAMFNITIGDETKNAVGFDHVDIPAPLDGTPLLVEFHVYYFFATQITSVQALHSGSGGTVVVDAEDLNHTAGSLKWNSAAFTLDVQGSLTINNAIIAGAAITCAHTCDLSNATLTGSAPVHVLDGGALTVDSSLIQGSRTDEDIIVNDAAQISYTNSNGTGGQTDAWIRLLSQRSLQTNAGNVTVHATGLGYWGSTVDNLTDSNGHVNFALSNHARIVEWVDGNGDYHQESAEVLLTLSSNWGNFNTTIVAPRTPTATAEVPLPFISVKSIDLKAKTGSIGSKVSGDVVVENSGTVAVTGVNFWCYVGDELQDTTQMTVSLQPGESKTVYVSWYANSVGTQALECRALVPNVLKSITGDVTDIDGATSQDITWKVADEPEDQPLTIYAILVVIILIGTYVVSNQASKKIAAQRREETAEVEEVSEEKEYLEDDAVEPASSEEAV